jgi:predicted PurR-regulated permease PerM
MTPIGTRAPRLRVRVRSIMVATLIVAGVLVTAWVLGRATRVLGWVMAAIVLAALIYPVVEGLALRIPRPLALVTVLLSVAGVTALVVWASVGDLQHGLQRLRNVAPDTAADIESRRSWVGDAARQFGLQQRVKDFLDEIPGRLAGGSPAAAVRAAASRSIAVLITLVLTIFLLSHGPRLVRGLLRQVPEHRRAVVSSALFHGYYRAWGYLVAMLGKALVVGFAVWFLADLLHEPAPSVLGVVAGATSLVPRFGLALGGLPVILLAAGLGGAGRAFWAILAVLALQVADAWVTARLIEPRTVRVGPAVSLAVVLLATNLYGVGGAIVALAVVTVAMAVLEQLVPELPEESDDAPARVLP